MAQIIKKYSDDGKTTVFSKIVDTAKSDKANNHNLVSDETVSAIESFIPQWTDSVLALNKFLSAREKEVREKNDSVAALEIVLRDFWEVAKRRLRRNGQPAEVLTYYQLPLSGIVPRSLTQKELLATAAKTIEGDAQALAAGHPAMLNPSAEELQEVLTKAQSDIKDIAPADRAYDMAEEAVDALRTEAETLIDDALAELKFHLRKKDASSQRRIIQSYGFDIKYSNGSANSDEPLEDI